MDSKLPETLFTIPEEEPSKETTTNVNLREELLLLSKKGEIKQTETYLKKASQETLEKIKQDYDIKQLDAANEYISENLISNLSDILEYFKYVDNSDEMKEELGGNKFLKKELKSLIGNVTTYIPYIGLFCGGVVVAKYVYNKLNKDNNDKDDTKNQANEDQT